MPNVQNVQNKSKVPIRRSLRILYSRIAHFAHCPIAGDPPCVIAASSLLRYLPPVSFLSSSAVHSESHFHFIYAAIMKDLTHFYYSLQED